MSEKKLSVRYTRDGAELVTDELSDREREEAKDLFDGGWRDAGDMRNEIGLS